ncbi:DinB family protein [Pedobacter sp. SYSU D00535]|uniref:DinB family protein n=1 Tax=Pedobacter sp. SYSU D00535 TaxID=2810308 RepID=UPI001A97864E|nr:DinB family protein [Pedobacter sp. SYSU D00535]
MNTTTNSPNHLVKNLLLTQFNLHQRLYNNVLDGISDEESNQRLYENTAMNHVKYLAGHLLNSQYGLATGIGLPVEVKWNDLFAVMGQSAARDNYAYPSIEEIRSEWNRLYEPLHQALERASTEALNEKPDAPFDQVATSKGELWAFINHHIAYHIGQIAILRRGFGKPAMRYD